MARTPNIFPSEIFLVPSFLRDRRRKEARHGDTAPTMNAVTPIMELPSTRKTLAMPSRVQILENEEQSIGITGRMGSTR